MFYIIDKQHQVHTVSMEEWAQFMEGTDRFLKQEKVWPWYVSTVFLGLDHGMGLTRDPVLFETMVFRFGREATLFRFTSYDEAISKHEEIVDSLQTSKHILYAAIAFLLVVMIAIILL